MEGRRNPTATFGETFFTFLVASLFTAASSREDREIKSLHVLSLPFIYQAKTNKRYKEQVYG